MQLVYVDGKFLKYDQKKSLDLSDIVKRALFYDASAKAWGNILSQDPKSKLDQLKNWTEFNERKWILLKKNTSKFTNEKYEQQGPYCSREIYEMICQSQVRLRDPIWKNGMTQWQLIQENATFKALKTFNDPIEDDIADILGSIVEYDPEMRRVEEKFPSPEDSGEVFIILDDK